MRRTAVVTGAGRGIGRAIAEALRPDANVVGFDVEFPETTPWLTGSFTVDVRDAASIREAFHEVRTQYGHPEVIVCAAGVIRDRVSWKMTDDEWDAVLDVNLGGVFRVIREATPGLRQVAHGRVIVIGSINGARGRFGQVNYAAAKAGLVGMARTLALELSRDGVTVNVVAPGLIDTPMTSALPEAVRARSVAQTPLGRMGTPADVAAAVRFLASEDASFITGVVLPVDGGQLLGHVL